MRSIYLCLFSVFFILGCNSSPSISPNELPEGHIGQAYNEKIEIEKVIFNDTLFVDANFDSVSGLTLNEGIGIPPYADNTIAITGTPKKVGYYKVVIDGQTRDAYGGKINFRKEYDLVIKNK